MEYEKHIRETKDGGRIERIEYSSGFYDHYEYDKNGKLKYREYNNGIFHGRGITRVFYDYYNDGSNITFYRYPDGSMEFVKC